MTTFRINKSCRWRLRIVPPRYQDLVSDNNALLAVMRDKGLWQTYSGPRIRQTLQISKQTAQWYNGYDVLLNPAIDLFADAWFEPKMVVVPIILSKQEILNNQGEAQLMDVLDSYMAAAESALEDAMDSALHAAGGGKQLTGLQTAIPTANTTGVYGGIDRAQNTWWQTQYFNVQTYIAGVTQVTSVTVRPLLNRMMTAQSRGKDYADLLLMSPQHYEAYDAATVAIQRQTSGTLGQAGLLDAGVHWRRQAGDHRAGRRYRVRYASRHDLRLAHRQLAAALSPQP